VDDAYLGGELAGGKAGRGSENKVPFVVASRLVPKVDPCILKWHRFLVLRAKRFQLANADLSPNCIVTSDGLGCFAGLLMLAANTGQSSRAVASQGLAGIQLDQHSLGNLKPAGRRLSCVRFC